MSKSVFLGEILDVQNGFAFDSKNFSPSAPIGLIRIRDLRNGTVTETGYAGSYDPAYLVHAGDFLIGMDGEFRCYMWKGAPALLNQRVCRLHKFRHDVDPRYVFYGINAHLERIEAETGYTTVKHLSSRTIKEIEFYLPPLAEQKRIVAKLDEVMALGDLLQDRSALERARSEELRQRMTVELMESSGPLIALGGLCEVLDSKRQPITKKDRAPGPIPYYGATGVVDYVRDFIFDEDLVLLGEDGAKWGPGDKSAFGISGRTWVNNHAHVLRPDRKVVRDQWLIEYLNAVDLGDYVTGLTVPKLNQAQMRSIPVPVPTLAVQDELLSRLDAVFELSGRLGEIAATRKAKAGELRQSVLAAAFRGDL